MSEGLRDKVIGGAITLVVTLIAAIIMVWWTKPAHQKGMILVTTQDYKDRITYKSPEKNVEDYAAKYDFFNVEKPLTNVSVLIPIKLSITDPVKLPIVETTVRNAVVKIVSKPDEISREGGVKLQIDSIGEGGYFEIVIRHPAPISNIYLTPIANTNGVRIVTPETIFLHWD